MQDKGYASRALLLLNSLISAAEKRAAALYRRGDVESALAMRREILMMAHARRRLRSLRGE